MRRTWTTSSGKSIPEPTHSQYTKGVLAAGVYDGVEREKDEDPALARQRAYTLTREAGEETKNTQPDWTRQDHLDAASHHKIMSHRATKRKSHGLISLHEGAALSHRAAAKRTR